ncbi:hypothetical protein BYT27DRAFT_7082292 [Phlegmacium glaucopus]|nr:hypothetical protein BYT27DRAFT_7082292 [Phlegmacium glaucopus]
MVLILTFLWLHLAAFVNAALFIFEPSQGSTCQGGQPCTVTWLDDGEKPLLSAIGVSTVGLYMGMQQLVQTIAPVDVANTHSITFTPLPDAGPNFDAYYIAFSSTQFIGNDSLPYEGFSPFFSLTGMSGSFDSPLPAATSSIPIPSSLTDSHTSSGTPTVTVGPLSISLPSPTSSPLPPPASTTTPFTSTSISRFSTSTTPASTSLSTSTSTTSLAPTASAAGASGRTSRLPGPLSLLFLAIFSSAFFFS